MIFKIFFCLYFGVLINGDDLFHFGIINHHTQWLFHCPNNNTKIFNPPSNEQPLISYECPHQSALIEIVPIEIDFTFLCRDQSRLIWMIVDLYQFNADIWPLTDQNLRIQIYFNDRIPVINSKIESKNYTNRLIIIHAFYIPYESIELLLDQSIEMTISIQNIHQSNQCQFFLKDIQHWRSYLDEHCHSNPSSTLLIQFGQCHFYSKSLPPRENSTIIINDDRIAIIPINEIQSNQTITRDSYHLIEENFHQILASLSHSSRYSMLLKLIFLFLILILLVLILFFLYMLCYHYHLRSRSSSMKNSI